MKPHILEWRDLARLSQCDQEQLEERAAIIESQSNVSREQAEEEALQQWNDRS